MALATMGRRAAAAAFHRRPRLGEVERLELRFLIDRQYECALRRTDIEADNIVRLGGELRVVRQLGHGFQPFAVARTKPDLDVFSRPARLAYPRTRRNRSSALFH